MRKSSSESKMSATVVMWCLFCFEFLFYVFFFTIVDELASDEDEINEDDVQYIESLALKVRKGNCQFLLFIILNGVNNEIEHHLGNSCAIHLRSRPPTPAIEFQSI